MPSVICPENVPNLWGVKSKKVKLPIKCNYKMYTKFTVTRKHYLIYSYNFMLYNINVHNYLLTPKSPEAIS